LNYYSLLLFLWGPAPLLFACENTLLTRQTRPVDFLSGTAMAYNFRTSIKPSRLAKEAAMESLFLTAVNRNGDAEPPSTPPPKYTSAPKKVSKATLALRNHREALEAKKHTAEATKEALNTNNDKEEPVWELIKQNKLLSEQNSELRSSKDVVVA
jgi:hypothetical protein